jgi:hypothetical protein
MTGRVVTVIGRFLSSKEEATTMNDADYIDDETSALDLTAIEILSVIRRQVLGLLAAMFVIFVAAGLTALQPYHPDAPGRAAHRSTVAQQPTFVPLPAEGIASARQHEIELP